MHYTALIVDDHEGVRTALKRLLETHDYEVLTAANGADALAVLAGCRVDVILLDLCMPVMDGILFRERQLADSLVARIPVVVISDVVGASDFTSSRRKRAVMGLSACACPWPGGCSFNTATPM